MNAKKGIYNILVNILSQVVTLGLGIIIPRLVLVNLGSEANGLMNSMNQILAYVALLEAGVGTASLQALYGPVAAGDHSSVNGVLSATHHFYKRTGTLYFFVILALTFVFPLTLDSGLARSDVMWVVFLSGMPGVVNYYFQGKFRLLLQAEGKNYVLTGLSTTTQVLTSVSKILLLINGFNIVALQAMYLFFNIAQMAFIVIYIKRHYKWLDLKAEPNFPAISQSKNALVHQVSSFVFNNTDMLILTYFCGLSTVSVYSMYTLLFGIIATMIVNFSGANFILGQTFHTDRERYGKLHDVYELYNMTLTFCLYCIANLFILPFLKLYTEGVQDISYIDPYLPYLFIGTYLLSNGRNSSAMAISFAGHFRQTQWRSILESAINLIVSISCVLRFGIYGVLLGTIAALFYRTNDMILYAAKHILKRSPWITYRRWLLNLVLFVLVTVIGKWLLSFAALDSYFSVIGWAVVACIVVIPLFFGVVSLAERDVFTTAMDILSPFLRRLRIEKHAN